MKDLAKYSPQIESISSCQKYIKTCASFYPKACYEFVYGPRYVDS